MFCLEVCRRSTPAGRPSLVIKHLPFDPAKKMPPRAHAHGGGEEEEVVVVRTDGPPFVDLKASPGKGFEADFERVTKYLGPGKVRGTPLFFSQ